MLNDQASGQTTDGSTETSTPNPPDDGSNDSSKEDINPDEHRRAVRDMMKYKGELRDARGEISSLQSQIDELKANSLKDKEDYKTLYETERANHDKTKGRATELESNVLYSEKYRAIYPALIKAGLKQEAIKILEKESLEALEVEATTNGRFLVHGVDTFVEQFKTDYPFAFQSDKPTFINSGGGSGNTTPKTMTTADILAIEKKHGTNSKEHIEAIQQYRKQTGRG